MLEPTSVQTEETTGPPSVPPTYRAYRVSLNREEAHRTEQLYSTLDHLDAGHRSDTLSSCRTRAWFARDTHTDHVIVLSNACRLRWCPLCSEGRSHYLTSQVLPWIIKVKNPKLLTLTLRHTNQPLYEQIDKLYSDFRQLRKHRQFKPLVSGGLWFFQVKWSLQTSQWHPHLHCLMESQFIPQDSLSKLWQTITRSSNVVDIRCVWKHSQAAQYVSRYAARPTRLTDVPDDRLTELYHAMHGRRLVGSWGSARRVSLSPPKDKDASRFVRLGSWNTVLNMKDYDEPCGLILQSWLNNQPLDPSIDALHLEHFQDDPFDDRNSDHDLPPPKHHHPRLF